MLKYFCVIVFAFLFGATSARVSPEFIHKCANPTPECLKKTVQEILPEFVKGIPTLGVDSVDPLNKDIPEFEPVPGLKIELANGRLTGIRNCIVDSAKLENQILDLKVHCNLTVKGKYKASGKILIVTLNGDGNAKIKGNNIMVHVKVKLDDEQRNGVTYAVIKDYSVQYKFRDRVSFFLTNIFKGNPELSTAVLTFLNENWKEVAEEIGKPIIKILVDAVVEIIKNFFQAVPKNELFI